MTTHGFIRFRSLGRSALLQYVCHAYWDDFFNENNVDIYGDEW